jgi:hypothetical protein
LAAATRCINCAHPLRCEVSLLKRFPHRPWFFKITFGVSHERRIEIRENPS